ncbi:MAG: BlaI/MecI/CopY family transcriptional regulator [Bacteroidia bacterium]|nr:BlaI/MecI/CopY family transcriptional regulator [Bacteroidia bacterium]
MQKLTKAEEQVMQVVWELDKAYLKEIMNAFPEPRPSQSTVSTLLRILKDKEFITYDVVGKIHQYYPLVSKEAYARQYFKHFLSRYFDNSFSQMLSFFHKKGDLDLNDLDELMNSMNTQKDDQDESND